MSVGGAFTIYGGGFSNLLLDVAVPAGRLRLTATVGEYGFPTVGAPFATNLLYTALPLAAVQYNLTGHLSVAAGKFAALLGQESPFTYQNINIQRGTGWAMEPTISRGVQLNYSNGPLTLTAQENDGYYSGHIGAFEGLIGLAPSSNTLLQFAAIIPGTNTAPNPTTPVGNKAEYDLMFTRQIGKLALLPYVLWVRSPASAVLGYPHSQTALASVVMGTWTFSAPWLVALRYENARNASAMGDTSGNADLVGFGPGSGVQTFTVTPTRRLGSNGVLRVEYSRVSGSFVQTRYGFEFGAVY